MTSVTGQPLPRVPGRTYNLYYPITSTVKGQQTMPAIEILGLEKTYSVGFWRKKPKLALRPLHLTVDEGEIFGFLGPNGAGKTTTLKLLMGLMYPTSGRAR